MSYVNEQRPQVTMLGLLHLIKVTPTLLPAAPDDYTAEDMGHRRRDEVHACVHCGMRAQAAIVVTTSIGPRWLDVCWPCYGLLRDT